MAARMERGRAKLLTRTGLDWSAKYPSMLTALTAVRAKTAYIDGERCGVDDAGLPSFAQIFAAKPVISKAHLSELHWAIAGSERWWAGR